jgi:hypothetical protein
VTPQRNSPQTLFRNSFDRVLAAVVGGGFFLQGLAELIFRLDEPLPLFFWLPTLWGGAALVLFGSFRIGQREQLSRAMVIAGALLGFLPSVWTVVMPVLIITLVIRTIMTSGRQAPLSR